MNGYIVRYLNGWLRTHAGGSTINLADAYVFPTAYEACKHPLGTAVYSVALARTL
mgnify:CR=1 FL=1